MSIVSVASASPSGENGAMKASISLACAVCSLGLVLAVGAPGNADKREDTNADSYVAPKGKAVLVLVRNRALLGTVKFRVIDAKRRCRGVLKGRSHVGIVVPPGKQKLYILAAKRVIQAERIDVNVAAGRTYIIETRPRAKMKERVDVETVRRGTPRFEESSHWIAGTKSFSRDLTECTQWMSKKSSKISAAITAAEQEWEMGGDFYRKARRLTPKDGRTKNEIEGL